ncbi:MAG: hypothetical protein ACOYB3_01625 [Azonexus sp.]
MGQDHRRISLDYEGFYGGVTPVCDLSQVLCEFGVGLFQREWLGQ